MSNPLKLFLTYRIAITVLEDNTMFNLQDILDTVTNINPTTKVFDRPFEDIIKEIRHTTEDVVVSSASNQTDPKASTYFKVGNKEYVARYRGAYTQISLVA